MRMDEEIMLMEVINFFVYFQFNKDRRQKEFKN